MMKLSAFAAFTGLAVMASGLWAQEDEQLNLFQWRGPFQTGVSPEKYEKYVFEGEKSLLWTRPEFGRGTPVAVDGRLYVFSYTGSTTDLRIHLQCLEADSGKEIWRKSFNDFISDTVYNRYSIGSPTVDIETRNVYLLTEAGIFVCFDKDGNQLWEHGMMESFGRLTFPNGKTGAAVIEGNLVIVRGITSFWGNQGPARDRLYAFDKFTGEPVWSSEPGVAPKDSSHGTPFIETRQGKRVFYTGTGCGNVVCVNALTGQPLWRYQFSQAGIASSFVVHKDRLIAIHGQENIDTTEEGRMIAIDLNKIKLVEAGEPQTELDKSCELWRLGVNAFSSSETLVGDRVYQMDKTGNLNCVDVMKGEVVWVKKLDADNIHSSPLYVDGKLYVPTNNHKFYVINPEDGAILHDMTLEGNCLGQPAAYQGRLYVHTTAKLYCFKIGEGKISYLDLPKKQPLQMGKPTALIVVPNEISLNGGDREALHAYEIDAAGVRGKDVTASCKLEKFVPPTAKVKAMLDASFDGQSIVVAKDAQSSAGVVKVTSADGLVGMTRGRIFQALPVSYDMESSQLTETSTFDGVNFAYPPLTWIGARFKWEVRELEGNKVLQKTLDNVLFQRATTFIGDVMSNYTLQADVRTDGGRRGTMEGDMGIINQRYLIALKGNTEVLEVSSNQERLKESVPFKVDKNKWYTLKTRVDMNPDGSGVIRGKAWIKGEPEPEAWTIEVKHQYANAEGAPGILGFSPQSQKPVYIDNIALTSNK